MSRTIVIGDVHGCFDEVNDLLDAVNYSSNDRVIFVGDLIDRGPDNAKCVDLAMKLEKEQGSSSSVLGNHEYKHLYYNDNNINITIESHKITNWQLNKEHFDWFRTLPLCIKLPEYNAMVIHAGLIPSLSLKENIENKHLLYTQMLEDEDGKKSKWSSKAPSNWKFWTNFYNGPERIIFGHSVLTEPLITEFAVGIDGGVCFGLELWAVVLPEWKIVKVPARNKVSTNKPTFHVQGNVRTY